MIAVNEYEVREQVRAGIELIKRLNDRESFTFEALDETDLATVLRNAVPGSWLWSFRECALQAGRVVEVEDRCHAGQHSSWKAQRRQR